MSNDYCTYHIRVANSNLVQVEKRDSQHQSLGQPSGKFRYYDHLTPEIAEFLEIASTNKRFLRT